MFQTIYKFFKPVLTNVVYNFSLGGETDDWGVSKDDDWADDSSIFEELLPPCDTVEAPDTPCSNATVTPPEIRYRDPVLSRLIAQVKAKLFALGSVSVPLLVLFQVPLK